MTRQVRKVPRATAPITRLSESLRAPAARKPLSVVALVSLIAGCGGGGSGGGNTSPPPTNNSVAVTVAGLATGANFVLQDASGDSATVSANGKLAFQVSAASGTAYTLSVSTQPTGEFCNVQSAAGTVGSTSSPTINCAQRLGGGSGSVAAAGGQVTSPAADITMPSGASLQAQNITVTTVAPPAGLPTAVIPVGAAIDVSIDQPTQLNAPLLVTLRYDASIVADETNLAVVHYNTTSNRYEPVTVLAQDTTAHSFTIASRTFSPFLVVSYDPNTAIPASHMVTNFTPAANGWNIDNFADYFSGGQCFGMSAFAIWYFQNEPGALHDKFSSSGTPSVASILAVRAQLAENQYWREQTDIYQWKLGPAGTAKLMKFYLAVFDQPLVLDMAGHWPSSTETAGHASVLYGYDSSGFTFYDVNSMNQSQTVSFDGTSFGTYYSGSLELKAFYFDALPALGRTEDFSELESEAESGFTSSRYLAVTSPTDGATITKLPMEIDGTMSSLLDPSTQLISYIGGVPRQITDSLVGGFTFYANPPLGQSLVVLMAGVDDSHLNGWYPNSAALFFTVDVKAPVSITPANPTLAVNATQSFSVQLPAPPSAGESYLYSWSLSGVGSLGATSTVSTTVPNVVYTAPAQAGQATLSVSVMDPQGNTLATATDQITIGEPSMQWTLTETQPGAPNGNYNDPFDSVTVTTAGPGVDLVTVYYDWTEFDNDSSAASLSLSVTSGAPLTTGMVFQYYTESVGFPAGMFVFPQISTASGTGTLTITSVAPQSNGTSFVTFTFSCSTIYGSASGSGSFVLTNT
jgi:hypothetical protein